MSSKAVAKFIFLDSSLLLFYSVAFSVNHKYRFQIDIKIYCKVDY